MGVGKRRLILLLAVVLVVVMVRLPTADAAVDEYIASAFSDTSGKWTGDANTYDGDWGTAAAYTSGGFVTADEYPTAYSSGFDSGASGSGTITQVDIIVRHVITGLDASDEWGISLDVGASTGNYLQVMNTANYALNNQTFTDVTEPNGGGWSWAEVQAAQIHFDCNKVGGGDKADWSIYELAFKITTTPSGNDYTAYPDGDFALSGSPSLVADFVKTLIDGFVLTGSPSLVVAFVKTLIESFALTGTTSVFVIIQKLIVEGFALTGGVSLVANFSVLLAAGFALAGVTSLVANFSVRVSSGFALGGTVALAVSYVKSLVEGFSLSGSVTALKVLIVNLVEGFTAGVGVNATTLVNTLIGSVFFQLFFGLDMWGYLGPIGLVIVGYVITTKEKKLGIIFFVVESLVIANYLTLVSATPDYWWHVFILLFGCMSTLMYSLWDK